MIIGSTSSSGLLPPSVFFSSSAPNFDELPNQSTFRAHRAKRRTGRTASVGGERLVFVNHRDGERISFSVHYAFDLILRFAADDDYVQFFAVIPREVVHGGQALHTQVAARERTRLTWAFRFATGSC